MLGPTELLLILAIIVILFGATRLPQLGRGLGEGIRNFRDGLKTNDSSKKLDSKKSPPGSDEPAD